jgi:hypothetical protein
LPKKREGFRKDLILFRMCAALSGDVCKPCYKTPQAGGDGFGSCYGFGCSKYREYKTFAV